MGELISQFYDYSRLAASDYAVEPEEIDAGRILREVFADHCLMLEAAHLQVETAFACSPVYAKGEKGALERILTNLLQNAGRYADSFLRLAIGPEGNYVKITFENDTKKISQKDISYLFEPFYMNDLSRNKGGSGLGLTIAKSLAEAMGGKLEAHAADGGDDPNHMIADDCICVRFTLYLRNCSEELS